jgi:hypothetical protein
MLYIFILLIISIIGDTKMPRPVQIGDYVRVTIGDQEYYLSIINILPTSIIAGIYNIIFMNDRWMIQDYPAKHSIGFIMGPPLPTYPEITSRILLSLNYDDLLNACRINKDFNKVCQDDYFWKLKVEHDYGMLTKYKPTNITYHQQYVDLMTIDDPDGAAMNGRLDELQRLAQDDIYPGQEGIDEAANAGYLEISQWLARTKNLYPSPGGILYAIGSGHLNILQWLDRIEKLYLEEEEANYAALSDQLEILKWMAQTRKLYPDQWGTNESAQEGYLEVLKWLAQTRKLYPDQQGADYAAHQGHLEVLKWLAEARKLYSSRRAVNRAAREGQLEVLQWLAQNNIYPD